VPVQGISSSDAAFSQVKFDRLKQQVQQGTANKSQALHQQTEATKHWLGSPRTEAGPGGDAVWMFTPQSNTHLLRSIQASGYQSLKLADAFFPFTYSGHMLNPAFHVLDPVFGGQKADYHI
jgi:hypothetical protein